MIKLEEEEDEHLFTNFNILSVPPFSQKKIKLCEQEADILRLREALKLQSPFGKQAKWDARSVTCLPVLAKAVPWLGWRWCSEHESVHTLASAMHLLATQLAALPLMSVCPPKLMKMPLVHIQSNTKQFVIAHTRDERHPNLHLVQPEHLRSCPGHYTVQPRSVLSGYAVVPGTIPDVRKDMAHHASDTALLETPTNHNAKSYLGIGHGRLFQFI